MKQSLRSLALKLLKWNENFVEWYTGVKCAKCRHCHEGRDCKCGCRVGQSAYPPFGSGLP
jgi:hypothetical protein